VYVYSLGRGEHRSTSPDGHPNDKPLIIVPLTFQGIKQQLGFVGDSFDFLRGRSGPTQSVMSVGQNAWEDRIAAEKEVDRWLSEYPSTFITVTGPPGSGKVSLVNRVLKKTQK
jgi:hypothetical protein